MRRSRVLGLLLAVLASMLAVVQPAAASTAAASGDQCLKALSNRVGGWSCASPGSAHPADTEQGWCWVLGTDPGCWQVDLDNRAYASFHTNNIVYGYGKTTLGSVSLQVNWKLSGPSIVTKPVQVTNSLTTNTTIFTGSIMNGATGVVGSVKGSCKQGSFGVTLSKTIRSWTPSGCTIYDNQSWDHESVIQVSWTLVSYPGYWWTYVKSLVAHTGDKETYLFDNHEDLPGSPWSGGWDE